MSYTSGLFATFLFFSSALIFILPIRYKAIFLLLGSYVFYASWNVQHLVLLIAISVFTYYAAIAVCHIKNDRKKFIALVASIFLITAILIVYKFSSLFDQLPQLNLLKINLSEILIPIGISYYIFKALSYLLDVYWETIPVEKSFIKVALFLGFFPQILSGPIQRAPDFFEQVDSVDFCKINWNRFDIATKWILLGIFEKLVLADHIEPMVEYLDQHFKDGSLVVLLSSYAYAVQLFADFSGLTHISIGLGLIFGILGPQNFNKPFSATNMQIFWQRWNMSLTNWLRDYIFAPLQMSLRKLGILGVSIALMINMIIIGIWHGSNLTFLLFGIFHGTLLILTLLSSRKRDYFFKKYPRAIPIGNFIGILLTFHLVVFALIIFRSQNIQAANQFLAVLIEFKIVDSEFWKAIPYDLYLPAAVATIIGFILGFSFTGFKNDTINKTGDINSKAPITSIFIYSFSTILLILLASNNSNQFIYARF